MICLCLIRSKNTYYSFINTGSISTTDGALPLKQKIHHKLLPTYSYIIKIKDHVVFPRTVYDQKAEKQVYQKERKSTNCNSQ